MCTLQFNLKFYRVLNLVFSSQFISFYFVRFFYIQSTRKNKSITTIPFLLFPAMSSFHPSLSILEFQGLLFTIFDLLCPSLSLSNSYSSLLLCICSNLVYSRKFFWAIETTLFFPANIQGLKIGALRLEFSSVWIVVAVFL